MMRAEANPPAVTVDVHKSQDFLLVMSLVATDLLMIALGFKAAYHLRFDYLSFLFFQDAGTRLEFYSWLIFWLLPVLIFIFWTFSLYDIPKLFSGMKEYAKILHACNLGILIIIFITFFDPTFVISRGWLVLSWVMVVGFTEVGRFIVRRIVQHLKTKGHLSRAVLIIGVNEEAKAIATQLMDDRRSGIEVVGFVDDQLELGAEVVAGKHVIARTQAVEGLIEYGGIQEVIIPTTALPRERLLSIFRLLVTKEDLVIRLSSGLYELMTTGVEVTEIGSVPLLSVNKVRLTGADLVLKRALDLGLAFITMPILLMITIPIAIIIKLNSPGPVLHRRRVIGVGGKEFDAYKFRTMYIDGDERLAKHPELVRELQQNFKLKDDPRITRLGKYLRPTSLDELPQIINVIKGEMSLVGPRMITAEERSKYGKWRTNLVTVRPGITGLWQVSGRSDVSYEERVMLDMHYIRNYSIWSDLHILWRTIPAVLKKKGAY